MLKIKGFMPRRASASGDWAIPAAGAIPIIRASIISSARAFHSSPAAFLLAAASVGSSHEIQHRTAMPVFHEKPSLVLAGAIIRHLNRSML